jgi:hypothetical protein
LRDVEPQYSLRGTRQKERACGYAACGSEQVAAGQIVLGIKPGNYLRHKRNSLPD